MQVEGCVYWGLLEAFIGANVLQESRLARIFLLLAKPFKWQALCCSYWRGVLSKKMFQSFSLKDMEGRAMFLLLVKHS